MYLKRSVSALLLSLAAFAGVYSQALPDSVQQAQPVAILRDTVSLRYFPKGMVASDVDDIFQLIGEHHPDMYFFTPKEVFGKRIGELKTSLPDSLTAYQAYSYIAPLVALVGEGHTYVQPHFESYFEHNPYWLVECPYIDKVDMKLKLRNANFEYREIVSINGRTNREIVEKLLSYASKETTYGKVSTVNEIMPVVFALVDSSRVFSIEYVDKDGVQRTAEIEGERIRKYEQRIVDRGEVAAWTAQPVRTPKIPQDSTTAILTLYSFSEEIMPMIDSMFNRLISESYKNLIMDLRDNGGGNPSVISQLLSYLSPVEFVDYSDSELYIIDKGTKVTSPPLSVPHPADKRFRGSVYLLIDNGSYSAAILFAHEVQRYKLGTLIGEKTGGSIFMHGNAGTIGTASGLEVYCSSCFFWVPALEHYRQTMEPVYPDIEVPSAEALDKALEIIASQDDKARR